jgi:hypothetical protein
VGQTIAFCKAAELLIATFSRTTHHAHVNSADALRHPTFKIGWFTPDGKHSCFWTVFAILLLLWLLGWGFHVAGTLIHLILVIAVVVMLIEWITGRRAAI